MDENPLLVSRVGPGPRLGAASAPLVIDVRREDETGHSAIWLHVQRSPERDGNGRATAPICALLIQRDRA